MVAEPLVSIVLITRNRKDLLREGLTSISGLSYGNREVIVVDNGSSDGTTSMLTREFPWVRLIALGDNQGIRARNEGIRASRGDFVLTLDDDVSLVHPDTLERLVDRFSSHPNVGLITLKICDPGNLADHSADHWWYPLPRKEYQDRAFYSASFCEAAAVFRRTVLEKSGLYFEPMFWGGEEKDLSLRILDTGADILYLGECPAVHWGKRGLLKNSPNPRHRLLVRNAVLTAALRLPWHVAFAETAPRLVWWFLQSIRYRYFRYYLQGLASVPGLISLIRRNRHPLGRKTLRRIRAIRKGCYWDEHVHPVR